MRILDVLSDTPWAIMPAKKAEIDSIYVEHKTNREKVDLEAIEKKLGMPLNNQPKGYEIQNGVAILPIDGVIAKRMSLMTKISGGVSTSYLQADFKQAMADPAVKSIILHIDSPGGAVDGTQELANLIHGARGTKPIVALADGLMASAAMWIGAAADQIYITSDTTQTGSIGVVATHVDVSKAEEQAGYKTTEITAGKFKRVASQYAPLSEEGRASIQDQVDQIYSIFLSDMAKFRGIDSPQTVHDQMGDGRIFIGRSAIDAGLVDGVSTLSDLIDQLSNGGETMKQGPRRASVAVVHAEAEALNAGGGESLESNNTNKENLMDGKETEVIDTQAAGPMPDMVKCPECGKQFDPKKNKAQAESDRVIGATEERERIKSIFAAALPGHEALVREMAFDGKTTKTEALERIIQAEREKTAQVHSNLRADAPTPAEPSRETVAVIVDAEAPIEERAKAEWDRDSSVRAEFGGNFNAFASFKKAEESGRARTFKK